MVDAFAAIGHVAIGAHPDETPPNVIPLANRLLRGDEVETVVLVEIINLPVAPDPSLPADQDAIAHLAIGDAPGLVDLMPDERRFLGDGSWCGRPDDFGAAHLEAEVRVMDIGELQEEVPAFPDHDRRATTTIGAMVIANGDAGMDSFFGSRTVGGQRVRAWLTDDNDGYSQFWIPLIDALAETLDPELDEARLELSNVATLLETGALRSKYLGRGGSTGDARLTEKYIPMVFGACFNAEPDLESAELQIDRWDVGALTDITAVRDGGAPLLWDGINHPDYVSLRNAAVAPGFFTKALSIGRTKRGGEAIFRITGDPVGLHDTTAAILLALARGAAGLPEFFIDAPSFGALPAYKVDLFLKGDNAVSVAEVFDALLRPLNAWYGAQGSARLQAGVITTPLSLPDQWAVESHEILEGSLRIKAAERPPVFRMGMSHSRNWTVMTPDELVDHTENPDLPQALWERLQRPEEVVTVEDSGVKLRTLSAIDDLETSGPIRGYFTNVADATAAAQNLFQFRRRPLRSIEFTTGLQEIFTRPGQAGRITLDGRLEMSGGRPAVITRRRLIGGGRQLAFQALAVVDSEAA